MMVITMAKLCMAHASTHGARMVNAWRTQNYFVHGRFSEVGQKQKTEKKKEEKKRKKD